MGLWWNTRGHEAGRSASSGKSSAPPWKDDVPAVGIALACLFNTWFCTNCLIDFSVDRWVLGNEADPSRLAFLRAYYQWREWAPIVTPIFIMLTIPLPILMFSLAKEVLASFLGWRRAPLLRHAADLVQAVTLLGAILPIGVPAVGRVQKAVIAACAPGRSGRGLATPTECDASAEDLLGVHLLMLILNLIMFAADIAKYVANRGTAEIKSKEH